MELPVCIVMVEVEDPPAASETLLGLKETVGPLETFGDTVAVKPIVLARLLTLVRVIVEDAEQPWAIEEGETRGERLKLPASTLRLTVGVQSQVPDPLIWIPYCMDRL